MPAAPTDPQPLAQQGGSSRPKGWCWELGHSADIAAAPPSCDVASTVELYFSLSPHIRCRRSTFQELSPPRFVGLRFIQRQWPSPLHPLSPSRPLPSLLHVPVPHHRHHHHHRRRRPAPAALPDHFHHHQCTPVSSRRRRRRLGGGGGPAPPPASTSRLVEPHNHRQVSVQCPRSSPSACLVLLFRYTCTVLFHQDRDTHVHTARQVHCRRHRPFTDRRLVEFVEIHHVPCRHPFCVASLLFSSADDP